MKLSEAMDHQIALHGGCGTSYVKEVATLERIASELAAVRDAAREVLYRDASADEHRILRNKLRQLSPEAWVY